jgi:hypothetical protein
MPIFESLIKECMEEANIEPDIVRKYARAAGCVSYFYRSVRLVSLRLYDLIVYSAI